jgi:glutamate dehydrogenase
MRAHRLRREIIATSVANQLVDRMGSSFTFRLGEETGGAPAQLARGFAAAREIFGLRAYFRAVEALDNRVAAAVQTDMLIEGRRLAERSTRWLVRGYPGGIEIDATIARFAPGGEALAAALPDALSGGDRSAYDARVHELRQAGVPAELCARVAAMPSLPALFDLVEVAEGSDRDVGTVTSVYFRLAQILELDWLRERILDLPRTDRWQTLARLALRDDLMSVHRALAAEVIAGTGPQDDAEECVEAWERAGAAEIERWLGILGDIRSSRTYDTTTLPVALREVRNLTRAGRRPATSALSRS